MGEPSSASVELTAQRNSNTYTQGGPTSRGDAGTGDNGGHSKGKVTNRARKERAKARQKSSAARAALATHVPVRRGLTVGQSGSAFGPGVQKWTVPVTFLPSFLPVTEVAPQHPANWCTECKVAIPGGIWNFQAYVRREHERPDVLPCILCGEEFSAHRGAEFFTMHLFGRNRWAQCKKVKEIYGVMGGHGNIEITIDNIGVLGRWIEQHRQDIVDVKFTCPGQWTARSTISRMLKRWEKTSQTSGGTTTAVTNNAGA